MYLVPGLGGLGGFDGFGYLAGFIWLGVVVYLLTLPIPLVRRIQGSSNKFETKLPQQRPARPGHMANCKALPSGVCLVAGGRL